MADPLTILGGAAAGLQLIEASVKMIVKTVKLFQDLKEAPREVREAVHDLTRSSDRLAKLTGTSATALVFLTAEQQARLSVCVNECVGPLSELSRKLHPFASGGDGVFGTQGLKRLWKDFKAVLIRDEIKATRKRIDHLRQEILCELEVIGLELQGAHSMMTTRVLKLTEETVVPELQAIKFEVQASKAEARAAKTETIAAISTVATTVREGFESSQTQARANHEQLADLILRGFGSLHRSIDALKHPAVPAPSRERDSDSAAFPRRGTSSHDSMHSSAPVVATEPFMQSPSLEEKADVGNNVAARLGSYPSALSEAHQHISSALRCRQALCRCQPRTSTRISHAGMLRFETERRSDHLPSCPRHAVGASSWQYSVSIWLSPYVNKAVYLTLGATTGAGGWSLAPPVRVLPRVRRSDSAIYHIVERHKEAIREHIDGKPLQPWKPEYEQKVVRELQELHENMRNLLSTRAVSAFEANELDRTVWDWVCDIIRALASSQRDRRANLSRAFSEAFGLLLMLCQHGVDPCDQSRTFRAHTLALAWQYEIRDAPSDNSTQWYKVHQGMVNLGALEMCGRLDWANICPFDRRSYIKRFPYLRNVLEPELPELTFLLMVGHSAQDFDRLRQVDRDRLRSEVFFPRDGPDVLFQTALGKVPLTGQYADALAVEMALGWPEALEYVVRLGGDVNRAFAIVSSLGDTDSVRTILRTPTAFFSPQNSPPALQAAFCYKRQKLEVFELIVAELASRRRRLNEFAMSVLNGYDRARLGILPDKMLVTNTRQVFETMTGEYYAAEVPEKLHCHAKFSTYEFLVALDHYKRDLDQSYLRAVPWNKDGNRQNWPALDILFKAGFDDVEAPDDSGETVLFKCCQQWTSCRPDPWRWQIILWLLHHSKERTFPAAVAQKNCSYPGAQFHIAAVVTKMRESDLQHFSKRARRTLTRVDACIADGCICFCSSSKVCSSRGFCSFRGCCSPGGCLPHYLFITIPDRFFRKGHIATDRRTWKWRSTSILLHKWSRWCGLTGPVKEEYYLQACRLELFERLEMAHTCCTRGVPTGYFQMLQRRVCPDVEERLELREEDKESARLLEYLLQQYRQARSRHAGIPVYPAKFKPRSPRSFWSLWWDALDRFLPSPTFGYPPNTETLDTIVERELKVVHEYLDRILLAQRMQRVTFVATRQGDRSARLGARGKRWPLRNKDERGLPPPYSKARGSRRRKKKWGRRQRRATKGRLVRARLVKRLCRGLEVRHLYGRWISRVGFKRWAKAFQGRRDS